jgi:hypothetical protein
VANQDYVDGAADLLAAAKEYGRTVQIIYSTKSGPVYAPVLTPVEKDISALVMSFKSFEVDGTLIKSTDKKMIVATAEVQPVIDAGGPLTGMTIKDGAETLSIVNSETVAPGDTVIMYKLQCRV